MKNNEKIMLSQLMNTYTPEHIKLYQHDAQRLKFQIKDIDTIAQFSQLQFIDYASKFRKATLKYQRNFKGFQRYSEDMVQCAQSLKNFSNPDFSFKIHSLNNQNYPNRISRNKILTELKLKFLQSEGVNEVDWQNWFIFEEKILLIRNISGDYKIKLGIDLDVNNEKHQGQLTWRIKDIVSYSVHNPHLLYFLNEFNIYSKKNNPLWQKKLIQSLKTALLNIKAIEVFTQLKKIVANMNYHQNQSIFYIIPIQNIKFQWKFKIFQRLQKPKCQLFINEQLRFDFEIQENELWGDIYMQESKNNILKNKQGIILCNKQFLYRLGIKINNFIILNKKCMIKYPKISSIANNVFIYLQNQLWKNQTTSISEDIIHLINSQGVWFLLDSKIVVKIQDDLSLTCNAAQNGYLELLFQVPSITIQNLILDLELRRSIITLNYQYQFKIYHMKLSWIKNSAYFVYQFKSYKYMQSSKIFRLTTEQQEKLNIVNQSNDSFVIIVKIRVDFEDVIFTVYKQKQGSAQEADIPDPYFSREWRQYKKSMGLKYDSKHLLQCISYLCKYYLVDRSYNKRMHEQQKKMTSYHFK